jgi:hypothetical protein
MKRPALLTLCALCVSAVALSLSCSQNEVHPSGPAPKAPENAREARPIAPQGAGMNDGALFVIARDPKDPAAPVAAMRLPVSAFPVPFTLTQAHSMTGQPLSDHLDLLAKYSASGAVDQNSDGDLEAASVHGHPGEPVVLVLEKR